MNVARVVLGVLLGILLPASPAAQKRAPNVLILLADDLGVDYVGCYGEGGKPAKTPNIDGLAARGVLFRNAWANPLCSPTRACLMTGRYGFRTGVGHLARGGGRGARGGRRGGGDASGLLAEELTLPKFLDRAECGYAHALVGKWHLGGGSRGPNDAGWSHFAGLLAGALFGRNTYTNWGRTVDGETATTTKYATTQQVDDALAFIRGNETRGKPWVCLVSFIAPHSPFHEPPRALHTQSAGGDNVARYRAMVEALDTECGRLLKELGPARERTNVIFMGDNGTPAQVTRLPFRRDSAKATIYEGGVNVPLVVAGPVVEGKPREAAALVGAVDMFATVAELCGVDVPKNYPGDRKLDSKSFVPHLKSADHPPIRATVFTEIFRGDYNRAGYAAIRDERYKMIRVFRGDMKPRDRMYDLQSDPFETRDLLRRNPSAEIKARHGKLVAEFERLRGSEK